MMRHAVLFLGVLTGVAGAQTTLHEFDGAAQFDFLGMGASDCGDVDADGFGDVVVGALGYNAFGPRAIVFSGLTGEVLHTLAVENFSSVSGAGDVDSDGHADIIVGDVLARAYAGEAVVFSGKTGAVLYTFVGATGEDDFGTSVSDAGDVNGDGVADIVVGATQSDSQDPGPGYAQVFSGADGSLLFEFTGDAMGDDFGRSVAGAGDVDADGHADIVVGAPAASGMTGYARVFSGDTGAILLSVAGVEPQDSAGRSVHGAGDVNADGFDDVIVGIPWADDLGKAVVLSGFDGSTLYTFAGGPLEFLMGQAVSGAGDLDGDGFADLIVSRGEFEVRTYSGADGSLIDAVEGINLASLAGAGDVNGDCLSDFIVGDPIVSFGHFNEVGQVRVYDSSADQALPLLSCPPTISVADGGTQTFRIEAGAALAGKTYFLVGTTAGTSPGLTLGNVTLPLNFDGPGGYLLLSVALANSAVLANTNAVTDGSGSATAFLNAPPGLPAALIGVTLHHAYVVFDTPGSGAIVFASNAVPLTFAP